MDTYVPNNPQFGLQLECNWPQEEFWSEDMALPLDLDPLPTLFPFSPSCQNNTYKVEPSSQNHHHSPFVVRENKVPASSDVADVLLSLKHAVVHPGQTNNEKFDKYDNQQHMYHHSQVLLSPTGYSNGFCDQSFSQQSPMFPSMSVNVSMNMTMHGYHPSTNYPGTEITCPQVQWSATPQVSNPVACQTQGLLSPTYGGTYSFTADFRPPQESQLSNSYKSVPLSFNSPRRRSSFEDDTQRPNICGLCGKSYARPSTLKTHMRTHSGEKPYRCIDCNKSFSQAANLTAHVRTHSGEKPFRCPVCDRRFSQSSSVTTHMRTHSGERPYRCKQCKKAFSDSSTLTKHLRIHSGEKPYECKLCLLRFSQSGNLNRHMRVHGTTGIV